MTVYKIQAYLAAVSDYDNVLTFTPDYVWAVTKIWRHWWLPRPRIEVGVIKNLRQAEKKALRMALYQARIRRRKEKTRVLRVTQVSGKETKMVIWDNGQVLDPTILSWHLRVVRWLWSKVWRKKCKSVSKKK